MKHILNPLKYLAAIALAALAVSCATSLKDTENLAVAAGFRIITPTAPDQQALLKTLPAGKVTPITHEGKPYYVLPDLKNHQAYVGTPVEYQAYQKLRLEKQISNDNLQAAQMNQTTSMNWNAWGGWGAVGFRR